jgi:hypothetical protein
VNPPSVDDQRPTPLGARAVKSPAPSLQGRAHRRLQVLPLMAARVMCLG